jgi:integrase
MKTGRKPKPHVTADNQTINGLSKMRDGRWRVIGTQIRFSEPDESRAIERFHHLIGKTNKIGRDIDQKHKWNEREFWERMAREITERPKYAAKKTGIEQLAYLTELKPPEPLPTFAELEQIWQDDYEGDDPEYKTKVLHDWRDFVRTANVRALTDITRKPVLQYRKSARARGWSGKSQANVFGRIRRLVTFARDEHGLAVEEINRALEYLRLLKRKGEGESINPQPIDVADWRRLYAKAKGDDRALLLVCLNFGMYLREAINLRWNSINDGCLVAHRKKTGRCVRLATVWRETAEALSQIERRGEYIFYGEHGERLGIKGVELRFRQLREAAGVPHVTSSMLRDGASTAAAKAGVGEQICLLYEGHRSGIRDRYAKRYPEQVAPACEAVYRHYFGQRKAKGKSTA